MKIIYRAICTVLIVFTLNPLFAQNAEKSKINFKVNGFVKNDIFYDSRQNVEAVEGLLHIFPKDREYDLNGVDINDENSLSFIGISSRIGTTISGTEILGAKLTGFLEVDFTGGQTGLTARVRMRHAHIKLNWKKTEVLFGQEWHPLFVKEMYPSVMSLNTGIPFQAFNRSPMLQLRHKVGQLELLGAAIYQTDYVSRGPDGKSSKYLRNSDIPNLHLQLRLNTENVLFGLAVDYKCIQPRTYTTSLINDDQKFATNEKLNSWAFMGFMKYQKSKFTFKTKAIYGQNLADMVLPGGYAVSVLDSITGKEQYTPYNHLYLWANVTYGLKTKVGLFAGYTKNLGANDAIVSEDRIYAMAHNVGYFYRITPTLTHKVKNLMLGLELEQTVAAYGTPDYEDKGKVKDTHEISNTRLLFSVFYFF